MCQMENKIISVDRILQYTCIPSEPPLVIEENWPDQSWPSQGEIDIRNLQVSSYVVFSIGLKNHFFYYLANFYYYS